MPLNDLIEQNKSKEIIPPQQGTLEDAFVGGVTGLVTCAWIFNFGLFSETKNGFEQWANFHVKENGKYVPEPDTVAYCGSNSMGIVIQFFGEIGLMLYLTATLGGLGAGAYFGTKALTNLIGYFYYNYNEKKKQKLLKLLEDK